MRHSKVARPCPSWVKMRKTQNEQMISALPPTSDVARQRSLAEKTISGSTRFHPMPSNGLLSCQRTGPAARTLWPDIWFTLRTMPVRTSAATIGPLVASNNLPVRFIGTHAQTAIVAVCSRSRP